MIHPKSPFLKDIAGGPPEDEFIVAESGLWVKVIAGELVWRRAVSGNKGAEMLIAAKVIWIYNQ